MSTHNMFSWRNKNKIYRISFLIYTYEIFFLFLHKSICCGYSLEVPQWGTSNEYLQHMFSWRNKKNINTFWLKNMPNLELYRLTETLIWAGYNPFGKCFPWWIIFSFKEILYFFFLAQFGVPTLQPMACLPRLIQTCFWVPRKSFDRSRKHIFRDIFLFYHELEMCPQYRDAPAVGYLTIKLQNSIWYKYLNLSLTGSPTYVPTYVRTHIRTQEFRGRRHRICWGKSHRSHNQNVVIK